MAVSLSQMDYYYRSRGRETMVYWLCCASEVDSQAACLEVGSHRDRAKTLELWARKGSGIKPATEGFTGCSD